jgi:hypothetical protein
MQYPAGWGEAGGGGCVAVWSLGRCFGHALTRNRFGPSFDTRRERASVAQESHRFLLALYKQGIVELARQCRFQPI